MKKAFEKIAAILLAAAMLLTVCACGGKTEGDAQNGNTKPGGGEFDQDVDAFIADVNDYLKIMVSNNNDEETAQALFDSIKLTRERIKSTEDDQLPFDSCDYASSDGLLASMYAFKNPQTGKYIDIATSCSYSSYCNDINAYFVFSVLSVSCACAALHTNKTAEEVEKVNVMISELFNTVNLAGTQSQLVKYGDACFYSAFSNVTADGDDPAVFFHAVPAANCTGYIGYDEFKKQVEADLAEDAAKQAEKEANGESTEMTPVNQAA